jgi:hypothetical protein
VYPVSEETEAGIMAYSRTWEMGLISYDSGTFITSEDIREATSEHVSTSDQEDIELGAVCSQHWAIKTTYAGNCVGDVFLVLLALKDLESGELIGDSIPMGVMTCVKAPRTGEDKELHLYDALYFADKTYEPTISLPARASRVEEDICEQLGITNAVDYNVHSYLAEETGGLMVESGGGCLYTESFDFMINALPEGGATMRQMLGYIAAVNGQFGCIDRLGRYTRRWYTNSRATIDTDHADEPTVSENTNTIVGIRCSTGETEITAGEMSGGKVLEMENPYMTPTLLRTLFVKLRNMQWHTAEICERLGDPRHDIGDMVTITSEGNNYSIPITSIQFGYDGGLLANISAAGVTEEQMM